MKKTLIFIALLFCCEVLAAPIRFASSGDSIVWATSGTERVRITDTAVRVKTHAGFSGSERYVATGGVNTADATEATAMTVTLVDSTLYFFEASCLGRDNAGGTDRFYYRRAARAHRQGGSATLGTVDAGFSDEPLLSTSDMTLDVSGDDVRVRVTGQAATTISWACSLIYQGVSTSS